MEHIAIMNKRWELLPKLLSGVKTIESRWYKSRIAPWNRIQSGDIVYFKDAGAPVTVVSTVEKVLQFEDVDREKVEQILKMYGEQIAVSSTEYSQFYEGKKYCILVFLQDVKPTSPFKVNKKGFGSACAWMTMDSIQSVCYKEQ